MSSVYNISIPVMTHVNKTYTVDRRKVRNTSYSGDISGIALWFYQTQNIDIDNITIKKECRRKTILIIPNNCFLQQIFSKQTSTGIIPD